PRRAPRPPRRHRGLGPPGHRPCPRRRTAPRGARAPPAGGGRRRASGRRPLGDRRRRAAGGPGRRRGDPGRLDERPAGRRRRPGAPEPAAEPEAPGARRAGGAAVPQALRAAGVPPWARTQATYAASATVLAGAAWWRAKPTSPATRPPATATGTMTARRSFSVGAAFGGRTGGGGNQLVSGEGRDTARVAPGGASGPAAGAGLLDGEPAPVVPRRGEDLDEHRALRPGLDVVGHVREDPPHPARPELARLAADPEAERALEQHADLLVGVRVLGDDRARVELDHPERHALAVHRPPDDAVPDPLGPETRDVGERAHGPQPNARPGRAGRHRRRRSGAAGPRLHALLDLTA